jgi:RNA polymerase sigma-70 factor (ECF subfamily)
MVCPFENVVFSKIDAMPADPSQALEPFRSYLEVLARVHLDSRLRGKLDPADVVQQALLRAYAAWPELKNPDRPVLLAWLRRILARTLADVVKHYERDKRAVDLEQSLEADLDSPASGLAGWLAADQTSPSQAAVRNEELLRLADALTASPEPQREVVVLKHLRGWTLKQIGEHFGRTVPAVASLLRRGLEDLRRQLK